MTDELIWGGLGDLRFLQVYGRYHRDSQGAANQPCKGCTPLLLPLFSYFSSLVKFLGPSATRSGCLVPTVARAGKIPCQQNVTKA